jgi:hypothetical protein
MKEIIKRWKSKTPSFFKKVVNLGLSVGVIGGAIITAPVTLPIAVVSIGGYMVTVGTVTAVVAKLAKEDNSDDKR